LKVIFVVPEDIRKEFKPQSRTRGRNVDTKQFVLGIKTEDLWEEMRMKRGRLLGD
jgi:hypothetical protein